MNAFAKHIHAADVDVEYHKTQPEHIPWEPDPAQPTLNAFGVIRMRGGAQDNPTADPELR